MGGMRLIGLREMRVNFSVFGFVASLIATMLLCTQTFRRPANSFQSP